MSPIMEQIKQLQAWPGKTRAEVTEALGVEAAAIEPGFAYEGLKELSHLHEAKAHPGHFYFRGDKLVVLYGPLLGEASAGAVLEALGEPALDLRSRAGKSARMAVWPKQGIAISYDEEDEPPHFVEIYAPMSGDEYKSSLYQDPGDFIR